jgi:hypothetical protein
MKMSIEARRGTSGICFYSALLFVLLGFASRIKMDFHHRMEISNTTFVVAAVLAAIGVVLLLSSLGKKA